MSESDLTGDSGRGRDGEESDEPVVISSTSAKKPVVCCPLCFKEIESDLEAHFELEHKEYECPFCARIFDTQHTFNTHMESVHNETVAATVSTESKPEEEKKSTNTFSSLGVSAGTSANANDWPYVVDDDNDDENLGVVTTSARPSNAQAHRQQQQRPQHVCPVCQKSLNDQLTLEIHVESHFSEGQHLIGS